MDISIHESSKGLNNAGPPNATSGSEITLRRLRGVSVTLRCGAVDGWILDGSKSLWEGLGKGTIFKILLCVDGCVEIL